MRHTSILVNTFPSMLGKARGTPHPGDDIGEEKTCVRPGVGLGRKTV